MRVASSSPHAFEHGQQRYRFCSARCRERFAASPEEFLNARPPQPRAAPSAIYVCPMHPEVRQSHPGACPKCGMALEPEIPSLEAEENNTELRDMTRRFSFAAALALPLLVVTMGDMLPGAPI